MGLLNKKRDYNAKYALTEIGKRKADDARAEGTTYDILNYLDDHSVSSVSDIARHHGYNPRNVEHQMRKLNRDGYITKVGDQEEM